MPRAGGPRPGGRAASGGRAPAGVDRRRHRWKGLDSVMNPRWTGPDSSGKAWTVCCRSAVLGTKGRPAGFPAPQPGPRRTPGTGR